MYYFYTNETLIFIIYNTTFVIIIIQLDKIIQKIHIFEA